MLVYLIVALGVIAGIAIALFLRYFFPKKEKTYLPSLTSRLKNIFIELHNYKFFHSPEGVKKTYSRYVGRVRLREKLKTILMNSETRSGAYLVTGFRGMGKTSLVRKAISEIKGNHYYAISRHVRLFLFLVVVYIFGRSKGIGSESFYIFLVTFNFFTVWYLTWHDQNRPNLWGYYEKRHVFPAFAWARSYFFSIVRILDPEVDYYKRSKFKTLLQDIFIASVIYMVFLTITKGQDPNTRVFTNIVQLFWLSLIHFFIIYFLNNYQLEKAQSIERSRVRSLLLAFKRIFVNAILRIDNGNKATIEISLSQDDLKEIDILKLLAKNIYTGYRQVRNRLFAPNRIIFPIIKFGTVYLIIGLLYYYKPIYNKINNFRLHSQIIQYVPSQGLFPEINQGDVDTTITVNDYINRVNRKIHNSSVWSDQSIPKPQIEAYEPGSLRHLLITTDFIIQAYYNGIFNPFISKSIGTTEYHSQDFRFLPVYIDYFFLFTILLVLGVVSAVERNAWRFGLVNHTYILKRLRHLNENIAAQIVHDQGKGLGVPSTGSFNQVLNIFSRRTRTYPIAGVREIENELIDILEEIDRIPSITTKPEFIFIFDELDKIEAQYNPNIQEREKEELTSFGDEDEGYFSTESIRRRQETIARILGNLKLFFNTARAKFIFIAGREMYDASLADISDRESFISSIFHEIIYVESFFKDAGSYNTSSITSTTEEFICQLLMPRFSRYEKNLSGFNHYLRDEFSSNKDPLRGLKQWINKHSTIPIYPIKYVETEDEKRDRRKVIYCLEQFIVFLTYRGNGAPKKITKLLEGFITNPSEADLVNPHHIMIGRSSENLYLHFDYICQYRLGLTSFLFKPYLIANTSHMRDFGDKMLIATSFLMDHLYKYHKVGFSWENLELTPEIIAINKSPELRRYISRLIDFMANSHIEEIINGLYQFKFNVRVAAEIKYISTISEVEAAAFNFTLDESLLLKRHYRKKLRSMGKSYQAYRQNQGVAASQHIDSIAYINTILGDLHFYDREYDEALIHYENAGQFITSKKHEELEFPEFYFLIRHLLKVGLTYEKTKDYDSAFVAYGKLTQLVRNIITRFDYSDKKKMRRKLFENIRPLFQPLLAQFQIMEKGGPNGVTMVDLIRAYDEFQLITVDLEANEKFLIETEFYNKVADLVYYKNGSLTVNKEEKYHDVGFRRQEFDDLQRFAKYLYVDGNKPEYAKKEKRDFRAPYTALKLYERSITYCAERIYFLDEESEIDPKGFDVKLSDAIEIILAYILKKRRTGPKEHYKYFIPNLQKELMVAIGGSLSDLSDAMVCFFTEDNEIDWVFLEKMLTTDTGSFEVFRDGVLIQNLEENKYQTITGDAQKGDNEVNRVVYLMLLANQTFLRGGDYYRCLLQWKKLLVTIKRLLNYSKSGKDRKVTINSRQYELIKRIAKEAIDILDRSTNHTRQQQVHEWTSIFESDSISNQQFSNDSIINQPDAREIYIIVKEIELYVEDVDVTVLLKNTVLGRSDAVMNNRYNRVFELYYKCTLNYENLKRIRKQAGIPKDEDIINHPNLLNDLIDASIQLNTHQTLEFKTSQDLLIYLISDSIYCLSEVLRSFNVFGITYVCNHSLNAIIHDHLSKWCFYLNHFKELAKKDIAVKRFSLKLESTLELLLGKVDLQYLDTNYHLKMSLQHCYSCLEMHQGGTAYKRIIEEMHYLDDDYDDYLSHFYIAEERYRINSGFIRDRIQSLKDKVKYLESGIIENVF